MKAGDASSRSSCVFARPAAIPSRTPNTAESTAEMPDERDRRPGLALDLVPDRLVAGVRATEVELARLLEVGHELPPSRPVETELLRELGALVSLRLRPRNRFATGSPSTTRNRKKLKQTTNSSVASDAERPCL